MVKANAHLIQLLALAIWLVPARGSAAPAPKNEQPVDFNRQIRAILSDNCFACHGPDDAKRKSGLRLDLPGEALKPSKSGEPAIVPGNPGQSQLVKRILAKDEEDIMPPPKTGKKLTAAQIDLLQRWIAGGAKYQTHWAFAKPERPALPEVADKKWPRNEIDRFVLAKLESENLKPSVPATKATLIRRASLDATGLPPTPQEVDAFLADKRPDAYEKLVDRLLASPRFGEHMARYWMDTARYADSHGYHIDSERSIWKYREWVVNAFNDNLPFDQFTIQQLAGDLLPNPTLNQKIASGYVRCNMSTGEGGAIEEEYRAKYSFDRVEAFSTTWLGLTLTCARCHTHKYDPITHREYYQLFAYFNNLDEPVMDGNKPNPDPFMKLPTAIQASRQTWLKQAITNGQSRLDEPLPAVDDRQPAWAAKWNETLSRGWSALSLTNVASTNGTTFRVLDDQSVLAESKSPEQDTYVISTTLPAGKFAGLRLETLPHESLPRQSSGRAEDGTFRLSEIEADLTPPAKDEKKPPAAQRLKFEFAAADAAADKQGIQNAIDGNAESAWGLSSNAPPAPHSAVFLLKEPKTLEQPSALKIRLRFEASKTRQALGRFRLAAATDQALVTAFHPVKVDNWRVIGPFKGADVQAAFQEEYPPEKALEFEKGYPGVREEIKWAYKPEYDDGRSHVFVHELHGVHGVYYFHRTIKVSKAQKVEVALRADDRFRVWFNGKPLAERDHKLATGETPVRLTLDLVEGENQILVKVVNHQGECRFRFDKLFLDDSTLPTPVAAILAVTGKPEGDDAKKLRNHYRTLNSVDWKQAAEEVALWREEDEAIEKAIPTTLVAKEAAKPRDTFMLVRGEYDKHGEKVQPGVPAFLSPLPADAPTNRLGLAQWLVHPDHPLTARVVVNRFWQQYFGVGLVKTAEDFGVQGENPSHPQLLDWLATEFMQSGWDVKHLQRLILTSATYRQTSKAPLESRARDPENRLLSRGPRFRLDAETLRDTALAVGGILVEQIGGRSVKPYQPGGLWEAVSFNNSQKYEQDQGDAQYRRSMYTYWKRQSPPPNMLLFDAPTREYCVARRPRTNTPLQALALLNDPQFVEASRGFAARILREGGAKTRSRIEYGFKLATARQPTREEVAVLEGVLSEQLRDFSNDVEDANRFLAVGNWRPANTDNPAELAAWTTVATMLLNLDETVTKN